MTDKEARELTEGTAKTLRNAGIAFAAVMTIVAMFFMVRYVYPSVFDDSNGSKLSATVNFIKLLGYWGWKLTPIGILNFLIGVVHVLVFIALVLGGLAIDIVATAIPLTIGLFLGLFLFLVTWGSDKAFAFGFVLPMFLAHTAVSFGVSLLIFRLMFRIFAAVFGLSAKSLEYSIGFLGYKFYMERLLRKGAVNNNIAGALSEGVEEDMSSKLVESLNKQEAENLKKLAEYQVLYPEISNEEGVAKEIQNVLGSSVLGNEYGGYVAEATKRFAMRQINKTMDSQVETLKKVRAIVEELTAIQKAKVALSDAVYEGEMTKIRNEIRGEQLKSGQLKERIIKEEAIKDKLLELEEAEVEAKIQEAKSKKEKLIVETELAKKDLHSSGRGLSAAERSIQSTKDKIEMIKAKSLGLDMIRRAMEEDLTGISDEKLKKEKERLWAAYIMEKREE